VTPESVIEIGRQALYVTTLLAAPLLLSVAGPWMLQLITGFTRRLIESIPGMIG